MFLRPIILKLSYLQPFTLPAFYYLKGNFKQVMTQKAYKHIDKELCDLKWSLSTVLSDNK